jgi:ankyrin repeat protein
MARFFIALVIGSVNFMDRYNKTPLIYAAENGYHDIVGQLLEKGADVNIVDKSGRPALTYATKNQHLLVVETMLKQRVFINVLWRDQFDMTARHYAKTPNLK